MTSVRSMFTNKKRWIFVGCFVILACTAFSLIKDNVFAACNSQGYCYGTGGNPRGGLCGDPNNNGVWWDTCFGLSWQYYEWPKNSNGELYNGNISFPGSSNAGYATVSSQCKDYGGFWFLGYEVYRPSTSESLGYQVGAPRAGMLSDYWSQGYTDLYVGEVPAVNPNITLNINGETKRLSGKRYGTADDMNNQDGAIKKLFQEYALNGRLVSGTGNGASGAGFEDLNWFCALETPDIPIEKKIQGKVEVEAPGFGSESAGWNNPNTATLPITINEGGSVDVTFKDYMVGDGNMVRKDYTIEGDFVGSTPESGVFVALEGDQTPRMVGSHTQTISTSGEYCEFLTFVDNGVIRVMQACAVVKVIPTPPEIYGRVGVEATIYDENGDEKSTVALQWTDWNDANQLVVPIQIDNTDTVSIKFTDSMKGVGANAMDVDYVVTNNALAGKKYEGTFEYAGTSASGQAAVVKETNFSDVNKAEPICEKLAFGEDENRQEIVACVNISKGPDPDLTSSINDSDGFDFNVDVDLKLSVSLSNHLIKDSGVNGEFLRDYTTLGVSSNNYLGYVATFTTDKNSTNENATNLVHDYMDSVVPTLTGSVTRGEFPAGRWGYSMNDTLNGDDTSTYSPLVAMDSATPITVINVNGPHTQNQDIYFGAKMDVIQPTGTYSNSIVFKVVAKIAEPAPTTINDIEYMQEINDDVIASMVVNQQYQLTDVRDGKKYWVVKLKNDYVVMSQDLAFELHYGDVLSSDTTDIGYGNYYGGYKSGRSYWFVDHNTMTDATNPVESWRSYSYVTASGDLLPNHVDRNSYSYNTMGGYSLLSAPTSKYWTTPVSGQCYVNGLNSSSSECNSAGEYYLDDADCASSTGLTEAECAHRRLGVLYNSATANAGGESIINPSIGNDDRFKDYVMTDSVCPKGWRLFTYAEMDILRDGKFRSSDTNNDYNGAPLYFRSFWLSHSYYADYIVYFYTDSVSSESQYASYYNYLQPVRCVARYGMKN